MHSPLKTTIARLFATALFAAGSAANATCWEDAQHEYSIPVDVLKAIAKTESNFNQDAKNVNQNGTTDIGMMQINSSWLPELGKYSITRADLEKDACLNVKVGAWILSNNVKKLGWNWDAIGAYNVGCAKLGREDCQARRSSYAWKIHAALQKVATLAGSVPKRTAAPTVLASASGQNSMQGIPKIVNVRIATDTPVAITDVESPAVEEGGAGFFFYQEDNGK